MPEKCILWEKWVDSENLGGNSPKYSCVQQQYFLENNFYELVVNPPKKFIKKKKKKKTAQSWKLF